MFELYIRSLICDEFTCVSWWLGSWQETRKLATRFCTEYGMITRVVPAA